MITAKEAAQLVVQNTYGKVDAEKQMLEIEESIKAAISENRRGVNCNWLLGENHNKLKELGYSVLDERSGTDGVRYTPILW